MSESTEADERRWREYFPTLPYRTPVAGSLSFALAFAAYAVLVEGALLVASVPERNDLATALALLAVGVLATSVAVVPKWLRTAVESDDAEALGHYLLGAGVIGGFLIAYRVLVEVVATADSSPAVLWSPALVLSALLGVLVGVFSRPLVPVDPDELARPGAYLEHHLTNWWRFVQLTGSAFLAFGIGIAVTQLESASSAARRTGEFLPLLAVVAAGGVVVLALFAAVKFHVVGAELRDVYGDG